MKERSTWDSFFKKESLSLFELESSWVLISVHPVKEYIVKPQ